MVVALTGLWYTLIFLAVAILSFFLGAIIGIAGEQKRDPNRIGTLIVAPKDEDGGPYFFLTTNRPTQEWVNEPTVKVGIRKVTKEELESRRSQK